MPKRIALGLVATSVIAAALSSVTTGAEASTATPLSAKRSVTLTASATDVEEGDRLKLTAKIKKNPAKGTRVTLQRWGGTSEGWEDVQTKQARGKAKIKFKVVATALDVERFRARVKQDRQSSKSRELAVTVWRWIPLSDYSAYAQTTGVGFTRFAINGRTYTGWSPRIYSHLGAWESKFTPGRNCRSFRGVVGLSDASDDGSSGVVKVTADDAVIYESPTLTPGMDVPLTLPIGRPYRFGLQSFDTSTGEAESWPAVGDPSLLCTGVD